MDMGQPMNGSAGRQPSRRMPGSDQSLTPNWGKRVATAGLIAFLGGCSTLNSTFKDVGDFILPKSGSWFEEAPKKAPDNGTGFTRIAEQAATSELKSGGWIVGDEPRAVMAAREMLAQGGSAGDAAAALGLALAVTYPAAAGLGGGGVCVVREGAEGAPEVIDFQVAPAASGGAHGVPMLVRGMAAVQVSAGGKFQWARVVGPAEKLAAGGYEISQATAQAVARQGAAKANAISILYGTAPAGVVPKAVTEQPELARILAGVRKGPGEFYRGALAEEVAAASRSLGGKLTAGDLAASKVTRVAPQGRRAGSLTAWFPQGSNLAPAFDAALAGDRFLSTAPGGWPGLLAGAVPAGEADDAVTGFAVTDAAGSAVACALTQGAAFGTGVAAAKLGFTFAVAPGPLSAAAAASLSPVLVTGSGKSLYFAGAGGGGRAGTGGVAAAALGSAFLSDGSLAGALASAGTTPAQRANGIYCRKGLPDDPASCQGGIDPNGAGYAIDLR